MIRLVDLTAEGIKNECDRYVSNLCQKSYVNRQELKIGKRCLGGKNLEMKILAGALKNVTSWKDYFYSSPTECNLYYKTTYYKLVKGSDSKDYIVYISKYRNK